MSPTAAKSRRAPKIRQSCDACNESRVRCSKNQPICERCKRHGIQCVYGISRRAGRRKATEPRNNAVKGCLKQTMDPGQGHTTGHGHYRQDRQASPSWQFTLLHGSANANFASTLSLDGDASGIVSADQYIQDDSDKVIVIEPLGSEEQTSTVDSTRSSLEERYHTNESGNCRCATEVITCLSVLQHSTSSASVSADEILSHGGNALQVLEKTIRCNLHNHRTYSVCFGFLLLVDQVLRLYEQVSESPEVVAFRTAAINAGPENAVLNDNSANLMGSPRMLVNTNMNFMAQPEASPSPLSRDNMFFLFDALSDHTQLQDRNQMNLNYPHYPSPSLTMGQATSPHIGTANGLEDSRLGATSQVVLKLQSALWHLQIIKQTVKRYQQRLAELEGDPPLNVGEAVVLESDDPVLAFISLAQRMERKREKIHGDIIRLHTGHIDT